VTAAVRGTGAESERRRSIYRAPWRIDITVRPGVSPLLPLALLARTASRALHDAGASRPASLGLTLSDDRELTGLNAAHMGAAGPTDVLSFPLLPPEAFPAHPGKAVGPASAAATQGFVLPPGRRPHLGDIVVSVERAVDQASAGRGGQTGDVSWSAEDELRLLVVHGVLHVCGWDHADPTEEAAMRTVERRLLAGETRAHARPASRRIAKASPVPRGQRAGAESGEERGG
jgi:probable rRNA maturation factor